MMSCEKGIEILGVDSKSVEVKSLDGYTISCKDAVQVTCVLDAWLRVAGRGVSVVSIRARVAVGTLKKKTLFSFTRT